MNTLVYLLVDFKASKTFIQSTYTYKALIRCNRQFNKKERVQKRETRLYPRIIYSVFILLSSTFVWDIST